MRNLTNDETEYTFGRNLSNDNGEILSFDLSANLPLVYTSNTDEASVIGLKGLNALGTANQILAMDSSGTNMIFKNDSNTEYTGTDPIDICGTTISLKGLTGFTANKIIKVNSAGTALEYADDNDTNFWNLNSVSLTPKLNTYNVIIGDEDNANANNVELLVYGDAEIKNTLYSTNNNENKIDFDTTYGIDFYGFYYTPSSRSYNMSFRNNQHGSYFPYLGVGSTGDFLFHINGRGDTMIMKADATRDILITAGDLIGETSSLYSKNRMKDIYCRNIYAEPIVIKNATSASSAYISMYEASDNGTNYLKLQAPTSLGSDGIDIVLPSTAGTIALQSEIRTDAQIRGLFSGTPPISLSASGVISTSFTPTSSETMENKTLKSPVFTSTSGAYEKMILKDENLTHNINIFTPDLTGNINIGFPSATGTLAITDDIKTDAEIRGLFSTAGNPITYNSSTGSFGWTNSNGYVDSADVLNQIASAENFSTLSILGNPDRTFGNTACKSVIQGTQTEIKSDLWVIPTDTTSLYIAQFKASLADNNFMKILIGKEASTNNCGLITYQHYSDDNALNYLQIGNYNNNSITINDSGVVIGNGTTSAGKLLFAEQIEEGSNKITLKPHTDAFADFEITLPSSQGQLALVSQLPSTAGFITETSTSNLSNKTFIDTLIVSPTNTSSFYIATFLAASFSSGVVEMVLGKANSSKNCSTFQYYHAGDGNVGNYLQIGIKTIAEDAIKVIADGNIELNTTQVKHNAGTVTAMNYISSDSGSANLIISGGVDGGGVKQTGQIILRSGTTSITSGTLDFDGRTDKLTLKCIDGELDLGGNDAIQITCKTAVTEIKNTTIIGSNRFKVLHNGGYNYISNPQGTNFDDNTKSGSIFAYHDNATELTLNNPNETYDTTNSSNIQFMFAGGERLRINGSANPCLQMTKTTGAVFNKQGFGTTFPTQIGEWSSQTVPIDGAFYIGGQSTNDSEGYFLCMNGQTTAISSPGDNEAFWWLDEDGAPTISGWKISTSGAISTVSDSRTKTNIKTYHNKDFEKYKKIRTITYNKKIPKDINPQRLEKQSCINKYNETHYGVIAEELYDLYPEIENTQDIRKRDEWNYRKENWNKGIYEKELNEWKEKKNNYDKEKGKDDKEEFKVKPPNKDFDEEMPYKVVDYERINIITIGIVQDLIKQNEEQQKQINQQQTIIDKLLSSTSFKDFLS